MLSSKKLTFSLTSLVVLLAFGLVCVVPSAFADEGTDKESVFVYDIGVAIAAGETMVDVSAEDGFQIPSNRTRALRTTGSTDALFITVTVTFSKGTINLELPDPTATGDADDDALVDPELGGTDAFDLGDVFIEAFDLDGRSLGAIDLEKVAVAAAVDRSRRDHCATR